MCLEDTPFGCSVHRTERCGCRVCCTSAASTQCRWCPRPETMSYPSMDASESGDVTFTDERSCATPPGETVTGRCKTRSRRWSGVLNNPNNCASPASCGATPHRNGEGLGAASNRRANRLVTSARSVSYCMVPRMPSSKSRGHTVRGSTIHHRRRRDRRRTRPNRTTDDRHRRCIRCSTRTSRGATR